MPGATTARLVVCDFEMPMKLFMMPQTVPASPTNGAVAPMVASTPVPRVMRRPKPPRAFEPRGDALLDAVGLDRAGRELQFGHGRIDEVPDLAPAWQQPLDAFGRRAHARQHVQGGTHAPLAITISIVLASQTVQVTTEAKTRPIRTAFTTDRR